MSGSETAPNEVESRASAAPAPRRRRWWRRVLWTLVVLLVLFVVLHTPPVKHLVATALVRLGGGALGAEVGLERLDYRLWAGEVSLEGVAVRGPRLEITCARAGVDLDLGTGLRVQVEAPRVVVTEGPETAEPEPPSLPSRPWAILGRLHEVELSGGSLELRTADGTPWLRLEGLEAQVEARGGGAGGSVRVAQAGLGWPGAGIRVEGVSAEAGFEVEAGTGAFRVLGGEIVSEGATLEGRGRLRQIGPILADAEGGGRIDAGLLQKLAPGLELEGRLDARVSFEKDTAGAHGSLGVEVADFAAYDVGPWSGSLRGTLDDRRLQIDSVTLSGYRGRAEATGAVSLGDGPTGLDLRAFGLDVKALVGTFAESPHRSRPSWTASSGSTCRTGRWTPSPGADGCRSARVKATAGRSPVRCRSVSTTDTCPSWPTGCVSVRRGWRRTARSPSIRTSTYATSCVFRSSAGSPSSWPTWAWTCLRWRSPAARRWAAKSWDGFPTGGPPPVSRARD